MGEPGVAQRSRTISPREPFERGRPRGRGRSRRSRRSGVHGTPPDRRTAVGLLTGSDISREPQLREHTPRRAGEPPELDRGECPDLLGRERAPPRADQPEGGADDRRVERLVDLHRAGELGRADPLVVDPDRDPGLDAWPLVGVPAAVDDRASEGAERVAGVLDDPRERAAPARGVGGDDGEGAGGGERHQVSTSTRSRGSRSTEASRFSPAPDDPKRGTGGRGRLPCQAGRQPDPWASVSNQISPALGEPPSNCAASTGGVSGEPPIPIWPARTVARLPLGVRCGRRAATGGGRPRRVVTARRGAQRQRQRVCGPASAGISSTGQDVAEVRVAG